MTKSGAKKWRNRQLRDGIKQDEAEIRRYARLLKLNRRRKTQARLPKVFKDTGLDYLLDVVGGDGGDDTDASEGASGGGVGDGSGGGNSRRVAEVIKECPESAAYYEAKAEADAEKRERKGKKRRLKRPPPEDAEDAEEEAGDPSDVSTRRAPASKRPDIYGRDAPDVLPVAAAAAITAGGGAEAETEAEALLRRRMRGLVNRVSERVLARISAELEAAYSGSARGPANRILAELVLGVAANSGEPLSDRILVDQAALVAVVNANVGGSQLGAQLAEMLVLRLGTDPESLSAGLESSGKSSHNLLLFAMFLCWLGVLSARLPFDLLQLLADLATEQALEALVLCLRHAGLQLRRIDGARMRGLLDGLQQRRDPAAGLGGEASARGRFLLELLQAVRNNNYRKIPGYDCEYAERARKTVKQLVRSEAAPVEFGVADIRDAASKGRWWVVGAAYDAAASSVAAPHAASAEAFAAAASADLSQSRVAAIAARLGLKTPQRRAIFSALVSAADADDAATRLLRLLSASGSGAAVAADVASIALKCALREARYNPFYAAVLLRLRRASRKHAMPIRCAVWDQLAGLADMRPGRAVNLAELTAELMLTSVLPPGAVMSRFPFELVPAAAGGSEGSGGGGGGVGTPAAVCLCALAGAIRRRAAESPELPGLVRGLADDADTGRALAAALVVAGRQRGCPDADWLLQRLRSLADESR